MLPSVFNDRFLDRFFQDPFERLGFGGRDFVFGGNNTANIMKTDIKETEGAFEVDIDLPGFKKEDITAEVKDGYLTVSADRTIDRSEEDEKSNYIRRERYSGRCTRSFYVGDAVTEEDIKAKFEDGILKLTVPKMEAKALPPAKYIAIE